MRETNMEKRAMRTVRRKKLQDLLAVLFFLLLLPYTCSALSGAMQEETVETVSMGEGETCILWEKESGVWRIPLEEFLVGALAANMPGEYRDETLKAQAVILRSICMKETEEGGTLKKSDSRLECLEEEERRRLWGEDFEENEARFREAVLATDKIVLAYEGNVVDPPYFRLSAGKTRSMAEIRGAGGGAALSGTEGAGSGGALSGTEEDGADETWGKLWCQSVECPHDLEADDFLQETRLKRDEFLKKLAAEGMILPKNNARIVLTRDSAGYVLFVRCEEDQMEGERFRKLFGLPSSCFYLKEEDGEIVLQTKGIGHGLGFDQYGADLLAAEGKDYVVLLNTFFSGLSLEKME